MRVEVLEVLRGTEDESGGGVGVVFRSAAGRAWARWCGAEVPGAGTVVHGEVDVPGEVAAWRPAEGPDLLVADAPGAAVRLRGTVDGVGEDSVVVIRLGGAILLAEFAGGTAGERGDEALPSVGERVEFSVPEIGLYPVSV
ncbi:hypothetical protein NX801_16280 [Streptomyces sp. LP05-1]|uniref:Uncharacterized protein n=1 Tax=Streptomyces pyxinae TaxID=2970734 RepID=A0ABT2CIG1_9ACTN|nr:hypothetical protein [Streptomyces sp. LP05-1]MCS0637191.1 hypothetical protein [Streptomyces sp. LP05-1]